MKEREFDEQMRRTQIDKTRTERKAREAFKVRSRLLSVFRTFLALGLT